jgi:hypothetical protein
MNPRHPLSSSCGGHTSAVCAPRALIEIFPPRRRIAARSKGQISPAPLVLSLPALFPRVRAAIVFFFIGRSPLLARRPPFMSGRIQTGGRGGILSFFS